MEEKSEPVDGGCSLSQPMAVIRQDDFITSIADALQHISYFHPPDYIRALGEAYAAAVTSGDVDRWAATLTDDVVFQPPDHPQVSGRAAVVAWGKESFFDPFKMRLDFAFDEIEVLGTSAFARGRFTLGLTPRQAGSPVQTSGKFMNIFRRESSGSWKYARASFSFDAPLAAVASTR